MSEVRRMDITAVVRIGPDALSRYVPPLTYYKSASNPWVESEFRCLDVLASRVMGGYWTGEPGTVQIDP